MDVNSTVNQGIKSQFVAREVMTEVNGMVEYILNKSSEDSDTPFSWDDVTNLYKDNSDEIAEKQEEIDTIESEDRYTELNDKYNNDELTEDEETEYTALVERIDSLQSKIEELEAEQEDQQEIYEWWMVSSYLADKLSAYGEPIIEGENIWGRTCSGQAILLDSVISSICEDEGILEA